MARKTPLTIPCSVDDCDRYQWARGLCGTHYARWRNNGTTELLPRPSVQDRIEAKSLRQGDCTVWTGNKNNMGYGMMLVDGRMQLVHRVVYELKKGPIPTGLVLDHLCRVPTCIEVDHLEPVTQAENCRRGKRGVLHVPGSDINHRNLKKTCCPRGHPYDEKNTYRNAKGHRWCRACARIWTLEAYYRKKAAGV